MADDRYSQDGPEAQRIASTIPYFPFKGIPRFYDISGMLRDAEAFALCVRVLSERYAALNVDAIAGLDARGFILGPPVALALHKPFVMLRKAGKLPNSVTGSDYRKEYHGDNSHGADALCMPRGVLSPGQRVLVIDDLVATGGTLVAACELLIEEARVEVVECACVVELKALNGRDKVHERYPDVPVWSLISEDILTLNGEAMVKEAAAAATAEDGADAIAAAATAAAAPESSSTDAKEG